MPPTLEMQFAQACRDGNLYAVKKLAMELDINKASPGATRGIDFAVIYGHVNVIEYLLPKITHLSRIFISAAYQNQLPMVKLLSPHTDIMAQDELKQDAFFKAAKKQYNSIINYFLYDLDYIAPPNILKKIKTKLSDDCRDNAVNLIEKHDLFLKLQSLTIKETINSIKI